MLFIFSTPVLIRHLWHLKKVVFLHWGLIWAVPLAKLTNTTNTAVLILTLTPWAEWQGIGFILWFITLPSKPRQVDRIINCWLMKMSNLISQIKLSDFLFWSEWLFTEIFQPASRVRGSQQGSYCLGRQSWTCQHLCPTLLPVEHARTAAWLTHPQKYVCKYKQIANFVKITFFNKKIRESVW